MKTLKLNKYITYLFWLGPILIIMGITASAVSGSWLPVPLGLVIAGVVIIGLWLVALGRLAPGFWGRRSTQTGTNAIIATVAMIVILVLINILGERYEQRVDFTENQQYTLSPLSQEIVQDLEQPLKVWVFAPFGNPLDRELLENYSRYGSNFEFEFIDPQLDPGLAQQFEVSSLGEVYLEYGSEQQFVQRVYDELGNHQPLLEVKLTNSIARITSDRTDTAYFLQGHGERPLEPVEGGFSLAMDALQERNFIIEPLNLAERSNVPDDASVVIVAGPQRALFEGEVRALREYLAEGGSLLVMIDPGVDPGLERLLADWGIELDNRLVIDASGQERLIGLDPVTPLVTNYGNHPITQNFGNGYSFYPLARPVETTPVEGIEESALLITNEQSWAESDIEQQPLEFNEDSDIKGPLTLAVALEGAVEPPSEDEEEETEDSEQEEQGEAAVTPEEPVEQEAQVEASPSPAAEADTEAPTEEGRLVVFGNSNFANNSWFPQQLNGDVFLNSVGWLSRQDEQTLSIRPKEQSDRRLNLTQRQTIALGWTSLAIVPLLGFVIAGVMWWQRR